MGHEQTCFLKDPSGNPGEDESRRRSETGGREMSNEGVVAKRRPRRLEVGD